jgi:hypothetical protein
VTSTREISIVCSPLSSTVSATHMIIRLPDLGETPGFRPGAAQILGRVIGLLIVLTVIVPPRDGPGLHQYPFAAMPVGVADGERRTVLQDQARIRIRPVRNRGSGERPTLWRLSQDVHT